MTDTPEYSIRIEIDDIPAKGLRQKMSANAEECAALAARFSLVELSSLEGMLELRHLAGGPMVRVDGELQADVVQSCVVTGDPVANHLTIPISIHFAPPSMIEENQEYTLSDADPPEPILEGAVDLGEVAAQQLVLALDPYPRVEGAAFEDVVETLPKGRKRALDDGTKETPFAKLAQLKGGSEDEG